MSEEDATISSVDDSITNHGEISINTPRPPSPSPSPPEITRNRTDDTEEMVAMKKDELAEELQREIEDRKNHLALELEEEQRLKQEKRNALAYRLKHGIDSDSEDEESHQDDASINMNVAGATVTEKEQILEDATQLLHDDDSSDPRVHSRGHTSLSSTVSDINMESVNLASHRNSLAAIDLGIELQAEGEVEDDDNDETNNSDVDMDMDDLISEGDDPTATLDAHESDKDDDFSSIEDDTESEVYKGENEVPTSEEMIEEPEIGEKKIEYVTNQADDIITLKVAVEGPVGTILLEDEADDVIALENDDGATSLLEDGTDDVIALEVDAEGQTDTMLSEDGVALENGNNDSISPELNGSPQSNDPVDNANYRTQFFKHLKHGFDYVDREVTKTSPKRNSNEGPRIDLQGLPLSFVESLQQTPLVNFIDPTSSSIQSPFEDGSPSRHMKRKAWNPKKPKPKLRELHIYEKFETVFHQQHNGTLQSVSYKNTRTNEIENIDYLPLQTKLTVPTIVDPAEWHNSPICHVYIAACCSIEHYRGKVRPSLRAFVNQIDGAGSGNQLKAISAAKTAARKEFGAKKREENKREQVAAANKAVSAAKDAAGGNTSCKYLIIFVPIHPSSVDSEMSPNVEDAYKGGGLGLGRRLAAANAWRNQQGQKSTADDEHSTLDDGSVSSQIFMLSKEHKEIQKKFLTDFPNGKTCVLSTLLDSFNNLAPQSPIQKQEFHTVCQELGKTVLSGFVERVERYNEELKRLEHDQTIPGSPSKKKDKNLIDWKQHFLIKDSVALTFEQMKLPMEAMNQYQELEATLPIRPSLEILKRSCPEDMTNIAMAGHASDFRKIIKNTEKLDDIQYLVNMYLFARQVKLLFLQKLPRAAVNKCLTYVKRFHKICFDEAGLLGGEECRIARLQNDIWAASACWDVKVASDVYTSRLLQSGSDSVTTSSGSPPKKSKSQGLLGVNSKSFMSVRCDVLNYIRIRLLNISEEVFSSETLLHKAVAEYPPDSLEPWCPWNDPKRTNEPSQDIVPCAPLIPSKAWNLGHFAEWIVHGLKSDKCFEAIYIEVCDSIIQMDTFLKRNRSVSRVLAELAEIYILKGDLQAAVENLLMTIDNCLKDPWNTLLSWRVFRLTCCQRRLSNAPEYLKSLTYCLGSRLSHAVPMKLRHVLTRDLQAIVYIKEISEFRWNISPLFGIKLFIRGTPLGKSLQPLLNTDVVMHTCEIGHKAYADIVVESHLAKSIEIDRVAIYLLKVDDYQRLTEANDEVTESDAAFVLSIDTPIDIAPGDNKCSFPWDAMSVGQFVIASVCVHWKHAAFYQDFTTSSNNVIGFDVLPNEPTQSIELNPIFLIPGHIQNVRVLFHSGSDVVNGGTVKLTCSQGLQVMPPIVEGKAADTEWQDTCEFDLGSCLPNATKTLIASVKSEAIDSYDPNVQNDDTYSFSALQTLDTVVTTSYHHGMYASLVKESKPIYSSAITAILEATITTLELAALTIKNSMFYPIDNDSFMISATVLCNTPVPFSLKEWEISLSSALQLDTDGDLNVGLYNQSVIEGEELFFGFRCKRSSSITDNQENQAILSIVLQDQFGKSFRQVLPLDIHAIERFLVVQDTSVEEAIVVADLTASSLQGLVGGPVIFTYDIDCGTLALDSISEILYHLSSSEADWIVGGSVRGTMTFSSNSKGTLSFVGIPTKAGTITRFPRIEMSIAKSLEESPVAPKCIKVRQNHPRSFVSLAHTTVDSMALSSGSTEI